MMRLTMSKVIRGSGQLLINWCTAPRLSKTNSSPWLHKLCFRTTQRCYCDYKVSACVPDIVQRWTERFTQANIPEPETSANLIVAHALGKKMIHEVNITTPVDGPHVAKIDRLCEERLLRCPVQYIIGEWDFHDMTLEMRPPVLIPRTETEELAAYIVEHQKKQPRQGGQHTILDIGCGSGALSLYLLRELPQARCLAVDIGEVACELTYQNACNYSLQDRLHVVQGSILADQVLEIVKKQGPYDIVVSNPPYIPTADMADLDKQVHGFEDHGALHGGSDGMDLIRHILSITHPLLKANTGVLWLEVDLSHPAKIEALVKTQYSETLQYVKTLQDYTHRDRFCKIKGGYSSSPG